MAKVLVAFGLLINGHPVRTMTARIASSDTSPRWKGSQLRVSIGVEAGVRTFRNTEDTN